MRLSLKSPKVRHRARQIPTAIIFGIAAWQSYGHIVELADEYTTDSLTPYLLPLSIDGMIIVATRYLADPRPDTRALARLALALGVVGTLLANVAVAPPNPVARLLSATPAITMIITALILHTGTRPKPKTEPQTTRTTQATTRTTRPRSRVKPTTTKPTTKPTTAAPTPKGAPA